MNQEARISLLEKDFVTKNNHRLNKTSISWSILHALSKWGKKNKIYHFIWMKVVLK